MTTSLRAACTPESLVRLAGGRSFERGEPEALLEGHDATEAFAWLVTDVRSANRRKRNLVKLLDAHWPPAGASP